MISNWLKNYWLDWLQSGSFFHIVNNDPARTNKLQKLVCTAHTGSVELFVIFKYQSCGDVLNEVT